MLDFARIQAITLDLDDTLWPVWPTIVRAETVLLQWLTRHAPATADLLADESTRHAVRAEVNAQWPDKAHDFSWLRRESIRLALQRVGDDPELAEPAFDCFFAERQRVALFEDALPALRRLSAVYPIVAVTNGNADVHRVGIGEHFVAKVSAKDVGVAKPDPLIFQRAAECAGVPIQHVLHVGDDAALDVCAAHRLGMQTVWINRQAHDWSEPHVKPHLEVPDLLALCAQWPGALLDAGHPSIQGRS